MIDIENFKFVTEDDKEYVILDKKYINNECYGYAVNLVDESDSMYVKVLFSNDGMAFEEINDINIIKELVKE